MSESTSSWLSGNGGSGRVIGDYSMGKQIGSGSFSVVWHARHRVHGTQVAIKEINLTRLNKKLQQSLLYEIFILKQIHHPNIIRLHDIIEVPGKIHLVLEYCRGGDLFSYTQRHGRVPEATAKHFMQQLATGLKVLRENNVIHRDLKPQNLLLSTNDNNSVLKIADFGFARSLQPRGLAETLCGSPLYMAPEIMQLQKYDAKADLWSVGIILYQFVTGKTPFNGINQIQLLQNIIKATELRFPKDINLSSDCIDLCQKLLRRNPVERLIFDEFFNHPFLSHKQLDDHPRREASLKRLGVGPLFENNLANNRDEISPDDCLPFLLDDDSSGPDGSPSLHGRRTFMKSTHGFSADPNREEASSNIRSIDHSPTRGSVGKKTPTSVFRTDGSRTVGINAESSSVHIEQRPLSSHSKALDSMEFSDQDYVLVSGPSLDIPSSSATMSKPSASGGKSDFLLPVSLSNNSRSSAPVPIAGPSARTIFCTGSLDSQSSVPSGTSQGSMDTTDALEQPSTDSIARVNSLRQHAATIKQLVNEMVEAGRNLDAFSIQLVILAIWKQALHICHTQAVSDMEGSSQDTMKTKGSVNKMNTSPDFLDPLGLVSSRVLEDVATEIKGDFFREVSHAEDLSNFVESGAGAGAEMPDAMETIYQSALALGRHGAVDELMGDMESAASSYSKAVRLLIFLLIEAPSLILNPPFSLTNSDRFRLRNYINILNDRQGISRSQRMALLKPEAEERQCPP